METLHSRIRVVWVAQAVLRGAVLSGVLAAVDAFVLSIGRPIIAGVAAAVAVLGVVHALLRYRVWQFDVQDDALYLKRGVITRVESSVPYVRVQHVDTQRGAIERSIGLASIVVYTAGSRGADVRIPGLRPDRARQIRERLRNLAIESEGEDAV
ncbi:MAG: PH domain-containing protein [Halobacteriales archaeon]